MSRIGALEGGGTKMVLGVYDENARLLDTLTIPTEQPDETVPAMRNWFASRQIDAIGVASFGPVDLHRDSPTYGNITSTPKKGWTDYPFLKELTRGLDIPAGFDTDVNAAALAEVRLGAAKGCDNAIYVTVGTGIGAGIVMEGKPVHGLVHPEVGHMLVSRLPEDPLTEGVCPYHSNCLEGMAAGPSLGKRCGGKADTLPDDDPIFVLEAKYLAQMCTNLIMVCSPEKIVLGGGVMQRDMMLPTIRKETQRLLGNYVRHPAVQENIDSYIVKPDLFPLSGLMGAYLLGLDALEGK